MTYSCTTTAPHPHQTTTRTRMYPRYAAAYITLSRCLLSLLSWTTWTFHPATRDSNSISSYLTWMPRTCWNRFTGCFHLNSLNCHAAPCTTTHTTRFHWEVEIKKTALLQFHSRLVSPSMNHSFTSASVRRLGLSTTANSAVFPLGSACTNFTCDCVIRSPSKCSLYRLWIFSKSLHFIFANQPLRACFHFEPFYKYYLCTGHPT